MEPSEREMEVPPEGMGVLPPGMATLPQSKLSGTGGMVPYLPDVRCVRANCGHVCGDHWDEGPCSMMPCQCIGMLS